MQFVTGKLVRDPGRYFESPEELLECEALSKREKLTLLMCWYQDLIENQRAREGYIGSETRESGPTADKLHRIAIALSQLQDTVH
jgi:hypothetical protein